MALAHDLQSMMSVALLGIVPLLSGLLATPKARADPGAAAPAAAKGEDATFEPRMEAPLPEGFPAPGPLGRVVEKSYPRYRAARAEGRGAFWRLFMHIKKNDVKMTAPVEMGVDDGMRIQHMAFLYEAPDQGTAGRQGRVEVLDLAPVKVLSVGLRGERRPELVDRARRAIEARLAKDGYRRAGDWRLMGYNSPMVPAAQRFWELQLPVAR